MGDNCIDQAVDGNNPFARFARGRSVVFVGEDATSKDSEKRICPETSSPSCKRRRKHSAAADAPASTTHLSVESRMQVLHRLREIRRDGGAPVDDFGTDHIVDSTAPPKCQRLHALLGALLSTQTKDEITAAAMRRLLQQPGGLTVATLRAMATDVLADLLSPVGFHSTKARQIKAIADILHASYNDDVPATLTELMALPGIGPKVARLTLLVAWNIVDGIIVDTHVQRIAKRLGWAGKGKDGRATAEATRKELEDWIPKDIWGDVSKMMIGFGQLTCSAVKPKCASCPLAAMCPSRQQT